jgi:hypothetical protein
MLFLALILASFWGVLWAIFIQCTTYGRYLALRRTWLTVVVGVGVDLLIMLFVVPLTVWLLVCAIIAASSVGIIARSLYNELRDEQAIEEFHAGRGE